MDSRKERWHPSPQLTRVLWPLGETMIMEGDMSTEDVLKIFTEAVMNEVIRESNYGHRT